MTDFWIGFIIGGFILFWFGFLGATLMAISGRASREEERMVYDA